MSEVRFFQAVLKEVKIDKVTLSERMENNGKCPECDCNSWILLPKESSAVREGGKPYCECMNCGYNTHL